MAVWRDDDPPFNIGKPRESWLARRVYRLRVLENRRPGKFKDELDRSLKDLLREMDCNSAIDFF